MADSHDTDDELLEEIRDNFATDTAEWQDIRAEGDTDMLCIAGDPWGALDAKGKKARKDAVRPCIALDELGQYINQYSGDLRENKRGIQVSPVGQGANDAIARFHQGLVRQIEYRSNAQQAYMVMADNQAQRGYGALRIKNRYCSDTGHDQELVIEPIVNPNMLTVDKYALRSDGSDMRRAFFHESLRKSEFKREYPKAKIRDFTIGTWTFAGDWIGKDAVRVAEYWTKRYVKSRTLHTLKPPMPTPQDPHPSPIDIYADEMNGHQPSSDLILKSRDIDVFEVWQYVTNGVEILKREQWPGKSIPFVTSYGKILYVDDGSGTTRKLLSLIRLARDPYLLYCYIRSCEAEVIGAVPRNSWIGYEGQFAKPQEWQEANHVPKAYLEAKAMTDSAPGQLLPLPQRSPWDPPLQNLDAAAEAARRAIQSAMGISPLPTSAQRQNQKSGKALDRIESSAQKGSFHLTDHHNEAVTRTGQILVECIPHFYDTPRQVAVRKPDDSVDLIHINTPTAKTPDGQPTWAPEDIRTDQGEYDVTISVGPAQASEREASSDFADSLLQNQPLLQMLGPERALKVAAAGVRLKNVGPIGDDIADLMDPKPAKDGTPNPQQAQQQAQQLHGQLQQAQQQLQQAGQIIQTKQVENQARIQIAQLQIASKERIAAMDRETKLAVAELGAKVDRIALFLEERGRVGAQQADAEQGAHDRAHDVGMAAMQHDQALQQGQAATEQQAALSDQGHQQTLEQGQQAAALQPPPADPNADAGAEGA